MGLDCESLVRYLQCMTEGGMFVDPPRCLDCHANVDVDAYDGVELILDGKRWRLCCAFAAWCRKHLPDRVSESADES